MTHSLLRLVPRMSLCALLLTALVGLPAAAQIKDVVQESFNVRPGGLLDLDLDRGDVRVVTGKDDLVYVELERTVDVDSRSDAERVLERHRYSIEQRGDDVEVESRLDEDGGFWNRWRGDDRFKLTVTVYVPSSFDVEFRSGAGNVEIDALSGDVEGRTGAGNVTVGAVSGEVDVNTGSGNVSVEGARGEVEVSTGAGNVTLSNVFGYADVTTGAGNIKAVISQQPDADLSLQSGAGNITVYLADALDLDVEATAAVGSVDTDFPLRVDGKWMSKSLEGRLGSGGPSLHIRTGVGSVSLLRR